ncbi:MAG: ATP-binding protein [Acidobacteria bacterium]|nr:ATP-binding protein [Acidobacteriota bacterium]
MSRAIAALDAEVDERRRELEAQGEPAAIDRLARLLGLAAFERQVILLCLAPELDPDFERLYAYVQDDATRRYPSCHLAVTLFGGEGEAWLEARAGLLRDSPLRRYRLVAVEGPMPGAFPPSSAPLRLDDRVLSYLLGVDRTDERLAEFLVEPPPALLSPRQREVLEGLEERFRAEAGIGSWPVVNLIGPPDAGKQSLARGLCERLGLKLFELNPAPLAALGPERQETLRLLERESLLRQFACYVDLIRADDSPDRAVPAAAHQALNHLGAFVLVGSRERVVLHRPTLALEVPIPGAADRRAWWQQALDGDRTGLAAEVEGLVQQFQFGPASITRCVEDARSRVSPRRRGEAEPLDAAGLWSACRGRTGARLEDLAQRLIPHAGWEDIVLPADTLAQLWEIAGQVACRAEVYETWGFGAKLSRGRGITALFAGASGTGKTMAAEILARHLDLDLYRIDLSGVVSKYIGETEKNLRRVFDAAEQTGAILLFDEADALFGKRSEVKDSHDRYANIEINYLLQRMEDYRGLAILATNMKSLLDPAFLRRLRFLVDFPFPGAGDRLRIWRSVLPPQAPVEGLDYAALARLEIAGGNIKNIALNAAFLASARAQPIRMQHLMLAARREYSKIDKIMLAAEFGAYLEGAKS